MADASRRDFLRSSLALFGAALLPYKLPDTENAPPEDLKDEVLLEMRRRTEPSGFESYAIQEGVVLGFEGEGAFCLAHGVTICFPKEVEFFSRFPCEIRVGRMIGPHSAMSELTTTLGDITHRKNLYFALPKGRDEEGRFTVPKLGWLFKRPVITQIGLMVQTGSHRYDAEGLEGGGQVAIADQDRMMICEGVSLMCAYVPERAVITKEDTYVLLPSVGKDYQTRKREYQERLAKMTPQERQEYHDQVQARCDDNISPEAWENVGIDVNDPSTYPPPPKKPWEEKGEFER